MLQRLRRSFRRKKASYCINCGHVSKECYHQEYENLHFGSDVGTQRADELKWLDLGCAQQQQYTCHTYIKGEDTELLNNNAINSYMRHVPKHVKNTNIHRDSGHIPVYNNYIPFPTPLPKRSKEVRKNATSILVSPQTTIGSFAFNQKDYVNIYGYTQQTISPIYVCQVRCSTVKMFDNKVAT